MDRFVTTHGRPTGLYLTLPIIPLSSPTTSKAIERSRSRWHWFTEGQRRNPALGTLSYLPVEVRWLIWRELAAGETWQLLIDPMDRLFRQFFWRSSLDDLPSCVTLVRAVLDDIHSHVPVPVLRKAIPLVGLEFDEMYLSTTTLHFRQVWEANRCLGEQIAPWQLPWIRHLSFLLDSQDDNWLKFFERDLPPRLRTITLDLAHAQHMRPYERYKQTIKDHCGGEACSGRRRKHHTNLGFLAKKTVRDVDLLEIVVAILMRNYPVVTIRLGVGNDECPLCRDRCRKILEEARWTRMGGTCGHWRLKD
ncbi:MAG: hypothetical protein Q9208_006596 [Pyrenodesmia sp. 3 TL-2023]